MTQRGRRWIIAVLLLLAGIALRAVFIRFHDEFVGDSLIYADLAHNLFWHHIYGVTEAGSVIRQTLIRLPGYPIFLGACFVLFGDQNFIAVVWVQALFSLVECCLLAVLASRLMGKRAGLIALGLAALCPFTSNYVAAALTETLSLFCITLALFSLERWMRARQQGRPWNIWLLPLGFASAYAVLVRPDQALLPMVVVPAMLWVSFRGGEGGVVKRSLPAAVVAMIIALPLLVWGTRNWRVFHVVQPLAPRYATDPGEPISYGFQRWYRTWAIDFKSTLDVYWTYDGSPLALTDLPPRAFDNAAQRTETERIYAQYNEVTAANPESDAAFAKLAAERVAAHPFRYYVVLPLARLADMWLCPRVELMDLPLDWWHWRRHPKRSAFSLFYASLDAAYLVLAGIGLWRWRQLRWSGYSALACAMVAFVLLRCVLLATIDNSEPRYTLECFPIVILLAAFALSRQHPEQPPEG
jgi:4-amino-4-deoxy-L-arabinose transferase-like glycosyltransferase